MRALCVAVAVVLSSVAAVRTQTGGLTRAEIADAIAFGETSEPRPYLLRHAGRPDNPVVWPRSTRRFYAWHCSPKPQPTAASV